MSIALAIRAAALLTIAAVFGPPQITVRPVTSAAGTTFELDVVHHTEHDDVTVTGRAEGVQGGRRVSLPLKITKARDGLYTVAKQWDAGTPWVLVFAAEQGHNGAQGVAEGAVLLEANGSVRSIEYIRPGFSEKGAKPVRTTTARIDAALKALGAAVPTR